MIILVMAVRSPMFETWGYVDHLWEINGSPYIRNGEFYRANPFPDNLPRGQYVFLVE